jgi:hypothetical protein
LITEPELLARLAMDDDEFREFIAGVIGQLPPRGFEAAVFARAVGYPWARPHGSYRLAGGEVDLFESIAPVERQLILGQFTAADSGRLPLLAIGSNAAPETLQRKFAHFADAQDRAVLVLTGRLHDFDVGVAAQPTMYGAMPATLFPSPGTAVGASVLWVTPAQFTQLAWSEISYWLGRLRTRFEVDSGLARFDEVLVFISRFGAFCPDGDPVALAAIPASGRTAPALNQEQLLDTVAALAIGPEATAEVLVRAIFEGASQIAPKIAATIHASAQPFSSERWTPFRPPAEA